MTADNVDMLRQSSSSIPEICSLVLSNDTITSLGYHIFPDKSSPQYPGGEPMSAPSVSNPEATGVSILPVGVIVGIVLSIFSVVVICLITLRLRQRVTSAER